MKKFIIGLLAAFMFIAGFTGTADASKGGAPDYGTGGAPLVHKVDNNGNTLIYEAKAVPAVNLCANVALRDCHDGPVGTAFYAYKQHLSRTPDSGGLQLWGSMDRDPGKLAQYFLSSSEGQRVMNQTNWEYAETMMVNAFVGNDCPGSYCYYSEATSQAISSTATDLDYGRIQRTELAANLASFGQYLGTQRYDFEYYIQTLADGYDLGQLTLTAVIAPAPSPTCDYYGHTDDSGDDCENTAAMK